MTKIDIISGFLGAGKTTLLKKLLKEAYGTEKIVLIENEFGEIGIDSGFLKEAGVQIKEMNSGCICCSLVGDFALSLEQVVKDYHPDRIIIEPSGVGKLSDVIKAVEDLHDEQLVLNALTTVVDGNKCALYMKNFGEFFNNQVEHAKSIIVSRTQMMDPQKLANCVAMLQNHNPKARIITTSWDEIEGKEILGVMEQTEDVTTQLMEELDICPVCHHDHEHHEHKHHHHEHGEHCGCGHHHNHAEDVFTSWGKETTHTYSEEQLHAILTSLSSLKGSVLRAKGMVESDDTSWLYFDFVPEEFEIRKGSATTIGKICVIGADIDKHDLSSIFLLSEEV